MMPPSNNLPVVSSTGTYISIYASPQQIDSPLSSLAQTDIMPPSNNPPGIPSTSTCGNKYPWQLVDITEEQQKEDITKSISKFLASVENDPVGPALAKFGAHVLCMHDKHDYFMKCVNHTIHKRMVDEKQGMEERNTTFFDDIVRGMKSRLASIGSITEPLPKNLADDMETWFVKEVQAYEVSVKKHWSKGKNCFNKMDLEMRKRHEEIREDDKKMLREQLQAIKGAHTEAIKAAHDSAVESYIKALREAALAQGVDIDPILAAVSAPVAVSVTCSGVSAPSTSTTAAAPIPTEMETSTDYKISSSPGNKRRRLPDHQGSEN